MLKDIVIIPSYTNLNEVKANSFNINKYFNSELIDNLRNLYKTDSKKFNFLLKELYLRGFDFEEKYQNNYFPKVEFDLYPYIYVNNNEERYKKLDLIKFSLSNLINELQIKTDLFFNYMPLNGFFKYIPKEKQDYFEKELLSCGFKLIYKPKQVLEEKHEILVNVNNQFKKINTIIPESKFSHFINFCNNLNTKQFNSLNELLELYKRNKGTRKKTYTDLYNYCKNNNYIRYNYLNLYNYELNQILYDNGYELNEFMDSYFSTNNLMKDKPYLYGVDIIEDIEKKGNINLKSYYEIMDNVLTKLQNHMNFKYIKDYKICDVLRIFELSNIFLYDKRKIKDLGNEFSDYSIINNLLTYLENIPDISTITLKLKKDLTTREYEILKRREKGETLQEIGERLKVTRERIRQINKKASFKITKYNNIIEKILLLNFTKASVVYIEDVLNILGDDKETKLIYSIIRSNPKFKIIEEKNIIVFIKDYEFYLSFVNECYEENRLVIEFNDIPKVDQENVTLIEYAFKKYGYKLFNSRFIKKNINIVNSLEYIFSNNKDKVFTYTEKDYLKLKTLIKNIFDKDVDSNIRSLFARVIDAENVILIDRNTYKYEDFRDVDSQFLSELKNIIELDLQKYPNVDPRNIFEKHKELMDRNSVFSYTHLYSIIKHFFSENFSIGFQNTLYIYKKDTINFNSEEILMHYLEKYSPIDQKNVLKDLKWKQIKLDQIVPKLKDVLINESNELVLIKGIEEETYYSELCDLITKRFKQNFIYTVDIYLEIALNDKFKYILEKYHIKGIYSFSQFIKTRIDNISGFQQFLYKKDGNIKNIEDVLPMEFGELYSANELKNFLLNKGYSYQKYHLSKDKMINDRKMAPYIDDYYLNLSKIEINNDIIKEVILFTDNLISSKRYINKNDLKEIDIQINNNYNVTPSLAAYLLENSGYYLIEAYQGSKYELPIITNKNTLYEDIVLQEVIENYNDPFENNLLMRFLKSKSLMNDNASNLYFSIKESKNFTFDNIGFFQVER